MSARGSCRGLAESGIMPPMKYWEIVADKLSAAGWSWAIAAPLRRMAGVGSLIRHREDGRRYMFSLMSC